MIEKINAIRRQTREYPGNRADPGRSDEPKPRSSSSLIPVNGNAELTEAVTEHVIVLADVHADWCGPCHIVEPTSEPIGAGSDAAGVKIDIHVNRRSRSVRGPGRPDARPVRRWAAGGTACRDHRQSVASLRGRTARVNKSMTSTLLDVAPRLSGDRPPVAYVGRLTATRNGDRDETAVGRNCSERGDSDGVSCDKTARTRVTGRFD